MRTLAAVTVAVVLTWCGSAHAQRPNVVVIMTDDQPADTMAYMPKTRALLGEAGTTFSNFIVTYPRCCPSRATFLTGQYSHNHGVRGNWPPTGGFTALDHSNTLATWLQAAGYHTVLIGKTLNRYDGSVPQGWSVWQALLKHFYYGFTINDNGALRKYGAAPEDYQTDVLADLAVAAIRTRPAGRPLFLYVAPSAPHGGTNSPLIRRTHPELSAPFAKPAPRHVGLFDATPFPLPPTFNEGDPAGIPRLPLTEAQIAGIELRGRAIVTALQAVDDLVERIVDELAAAGLIDKTLIMFTSDNGYFQGEHRISRGKYRPYNPALQVPLLVRGGGFPAGAVVATLTANIDLAPTIVGLTGATPRRVLDGRSLLPMALDPTSGARRQILLDGGARHEHPEAGSMYAGVRTNGAHYVEYNSGDRELFVLTHDPHQTHDRYGDAGVVSIQRRLVRALRRLETCAGAECWAAMD